MAIGKPGSENSIALTGREIWEYWDKFNKYLKGRYFVVSIEFVRAGLMRIVIEIRRMEPGVRRGHDKLEKVFRISPKETFLAFLMQLHNSTKD